MGWSSPRWTAFTLHVFRGLVWVTITFKTTVPSDKALVWRVEQAAQAGGIGRSWARWHRSRVSRVLPEHCGAYAVRSTRGLLRHFCAAFAARCAGASHRYRCRATSCSVAARDLEGFVAFWLSLSDIGERQSEHAWCMHGTSKTIVCDLWKLASTTTELSRATAAPSGCRQEGCSHSNT